MGTVTIPLPPVVVVSPTGVQGPRGPAGSVGPAGPKGDIGIQGPAGPPGGGGSSERTARVRITSDNLSGLPSAPTWAVVVTSGGDRLQCSIPAMTGDRVELFPNFMYAGSQFLDWVLLNADGSIGAYAAADPNTPGTPLGEGNPSMYPSLSFSKVNSADVFIVGSGNLSSGSVTVGLAHQGTGAGIVYAYNPLYPWRLRLKNIGPEPA